MMYGSYYLYLKENPSLEPNGYTKMNLTKIERLKVICVLLSCVAHNHMRLHQMDVKREFLNGKSIIGTKWVSKNEFDENGKVVRNKARLVAEENSLWLKASTSCLMISFFVLLMILYVKNSLYACAKEFNMSMMRELKFFLGLQIK
ncbi:hypothetical protein CR513_49809, partial [Mucuna pruriens]